MTEPDAYPPPHGEGDPANPGGGGYPQAVRFVARPLHHRFAAVPLPVPGRILPLLLLAACSGGGGEQSAAPPDLETAAIERGLVRDLGEGDVIGLYARDTDRVCVVRRGGGYRIGVFADYGDGLSCSGRGTASRSGEGLAVELRGKGGGTCAFEARFDGERITFPANLPDGCRKLCGPRASLAALDVERLSESDAEAQALRTAEGERLCQD